MSSISYRGDRRGTSGARYFNRRGRMRSVATDYVTAWYESFGGLNTLGVNYNETLEWNSFAICVLSDGQYMDVTESVFVPEEPYGFNR